MTDNPMKDTTRDHKVLKTRFYQGGYRYTLEGRLIFYPSTYEQDYAQWEFGLWDSKESVHPFNDIGLEQLVNLILLGGLVVLQQAVSMEQVLKA